MSMFDGDGLGCVGELLWGLLRGFFRLLYSPIGWLLDLILDAWAWGGRHSSSPPRRSEKRKDPGKKRDGHR